MFQKNTSREKKTNLDNIAINTVIDEGMLIKGDISGEGAIRIDGKIEGNIDLKEGIILGEKSEIRGAVKSSIVVVHGKLYGNIQCRYLYIKSTGLIDGDIEVEAFEVELGGQYNGTLKMTSPAPVINGIAKSKKAEAVA
ncbi:polymer-forming cytoskeletal protein [Niabella pedocola]|uniref:Polymer-forming cytoskeletal protein n=1 Tax=Niabella pedocola TaxID=1752077 RepID=A0ABS8Q1C6_9BACT|nr:polymer-forming cytoskeletal protein [Niabella pedocola]MCD2425991.1 polymer-forming cytoskeletal protein [Niabella pedocola]